MSEPMPRQTILVVDDTPENIDVLNGVLRPEYRVKAATNGESALRLAATAPPPDLILLDIMMPGMDGYEVCRRLKADPATAALPVIFVTAKSATEDERLGLELGAVDYITKPISPAIVLARVRTQIALYDQNRQLERKVAERTRELRESRIEIIRRLGRAAEYKDNETGLHVIRMSIYSRLLAEELGANPAWVELLYNAAPMHDIGKIGIPDSVLLKRDSLNDEEWAIMRQHPVYGAEIIGEHSSELLQMAREIALTHHEKWDGSGYPAGLTGEQIPLSSRIVTLADVLDALTTARPYKQAWSLDAALELIERDAGSHFDPQLVPRLLAIRPAIEEVMQRYREQPEVKLEQMR